MGGGAVSFEWSWRGEAFVEKLFGKTSARDFNQRAAEVADHFVEEPVSVELDAPGVCRAAWSDERPGMEGDAVDGAHGVLHLRARALHPGEIALSWNLRNEALQYIEVHAVGHMPGVAREKGVCLFTQIEAVAVALGLRGKAGVEIIWRGNEFRDANFRREHLRKRMPQALGRHGVCPAEGEDLAERMHARIGAPRALDADRLRCDARQRRFYFALHGAYVRLCLPSGEAAAIVARRAFQCDFHAPIVCMRTVKGQCQYNIRVWACYTGAQVARRGARRAKEQCRFY